MQRSVSFLSKCIAPSILMGLILLFCIIYWFGGEALDYFCSAVWSLTVWVAPTVLNYLSIGLFWAWNWANSLFCVFSAILVFYFFILFPRESILPDDDYRGHFLSRARRLFSHDAALHVAAFPIAALLAIAAVNLADLTLDIHIDRDASGVGCAIQAEFLERLSTRFHQLQSQLIKCSMIATESDAKFIEQAPPSLEGDQLGSVAAAPVYPTRSDEARAADKKRWELFLNVLEISAKSGKLIDELVLHEEKSRAFESNLEDPELQQFLQYLFVELKWAESEEEFDKTYLQPKENDSKIKVLIAEKFQSQSGNVRFLLDAFIENKTPRFSKDELIDIVTFFDFGKLADWTSGKGKAGSTWLKDKFEGDNILTKLLNGENIVSILHDGYSSISVTRFSESNCQFVFAGQQFAWTPADVDNLKLDLRTVEPKIVPDFSVAPVVRKNALFFVGRLDEAKHLFRADWQMHLEEKNGPTRECRSVRIVGNLEDSVVAHDMIDGVELSGSLNAPWQDLGLRLETQDGWRSVLCNQNESAILLDPLNGESFRERVAFSGLFSRLGSNYNSPSGREIVSRLVSALLPRASSPVLFTEGEAYTLLMFAFAQADKNDLDSATKTVLPSLYQVKISDFRKQLSDALLDRVEKGVIDRINTKSSGKAPFSLGITWTTFRSMIRGPIQLATFIFFFWGAMILVVRGFITGLLSQSAYFFGVPTGGKSDPQDLRWHEVWTGQHFVSAKSPLTRQIIAANKRSEDLLPFVLKRLFISLSGGADSVAAADDIDQSAEQWLGEREREYVFLDFVSWLIPSIGFLGTVIGLGQGLSLANKIVSPDKTVQAQSISDMTSNLGTAFYTTLIALVCVVPFTFFRYLLTRLQVGTVRHCRSRVRQLLFSNLVWNVGKPEESPQAKSSSGGWTPEEPVIVRSPSKRDAVLLATTLEVLGKTNFLGDEASFSLLVSEGLLPQPNSRSKSPSSQLRYLLENSTMFSRGYWDMASRGLFSYSHLYSWIRHVPPYFEHLAHVLLIKEHRPIRELVNAYHLDPIECGLLDPQSSRLKVARSLSGDELSGAKRQGEAYKLIAVSGNNGAAYAELISAGHSPSTIRHLQKKGLIESFEPNTPFNHRPAIQEILVLFCKCRLKLRNEQKKTLSELISKIDETYSDMIPGEMIVSNYSELRGDVAVRVVGWVNSPEISPTHRIVRFLCLALPDKRETRPRLIQRIRRAILKQWLNWKQWLKSLRKRERKGSLEQVTPTQTTAWPDDEKSGSVEQVPRN